MRTPAERRRWFHSAVLVCPLLLLSCCAGRGGDKSNPPSDARTHAEPSAIVPLTPYDSVRLQPGGLAYQGAFRLSSAFDWGARGATYRASGEGGRGTLLIIGNDLKPTEFAEVSIPKPVISRAWQRLPEARMLSPLRSFDGQLVESVSTETAWGSGIEVVPRRGSQKSDKLYGSLDNWYGVVDTSHATVWFSELDGSRPRGLFHVGPRAAPHHGNRAGDYLFSVPAWYADRALGGRTLVTGKTRGAFHGSQGPTLFAFRPWDSENPTGDLDAVALLWYRIRFPDCAGPNVGNKAQCDYPDFTMCDKWEGGGFVEKGAKRAILLLGTKGLGKNHYGEAPGPGSCESSKGYHCDPYQRQIVFYDVEELAQVAQGKRKPWSVVPYATWRPKEFLLQGNTCGQVGGLAVDPRGGRLFMIEKGVGDNNSAVVHVWILQG